MQKPIKILHLEDDPLDAELIQTTLDSAGSLCEITRVQTSQEFREALHMGGFNLVLADFNLPDYDGMSAMRFVREHYPELPFIFVSGIMGEDAAIQALTEGATDYVLKQKLSRLAPAVRRALQDAENRAERKRTEAALSRSEEQFRSMVTAMDEGVVFHNKSGEITAANPAAEKILGLTAAELIKLTSKDRVRDAESIYEDGLLFPEKLHPAMVTLRTGKPQSNVTMGIHKPDKTLVWVSINSRPLIALGKSKPYAVVTTFRDITERKRAEDALRKNQERYRSLFEDSPIAIWVEDFSAVKAQFDQLRQSGVTDFRAYWKKHPEDIRMLAGSIKLLDINQIGVKLLGAENKEQAFRNLPSYFTEESMKVFEEEMIALAEGKARFQSEVPELNIRGEPILLDLSLVVQPGHEETLSRVVVSFIDITARKQAEQALRENEERYRRLTEAITDYIYTVRVERGRAVETRHGAGCVAVTGYTPKEFADNPYRWDSMVWPEDQRLVKDQIRRLLAGQNAPAIEHRITRKDGAVRWIRDTLSPHYNRRQELVSYDGLIQDITERKQVEEALRESEEHYRHIVDTAYEGIWVVDETYQTTFLNARMEEMLGYSAAEVIGKRVDEFMFGTDAETDYQQLNQHLHRIGIQHERRFRRKDGCELWTLVSSRPIVDSHGVFKGSFAMFSDITERKQAEEALQASQQQLERQKLFLEAMLSAMPIPVFYKDTQGRYLGCNRAYTEVMGIELTEFKGKTVYDLWPHELAETYHRMDLELFENLGPQIYEAKVRSKSGEMRDVIFRKDVFRNEDGSIGGIVGTHFDITERKQTEERIAKERENFFKIFAAAPVGLLLLDYNTVITKANQSVADMIQRNPVDIIGKRAGEGWGCANSQESPKGCGFGKNCSNCVLRQGLESVLAGGPSVQGAEIALTLLVNGQLQKRWLSIGAEPIELDGKRHIVVAIDDITERKRAEAALRSSLAEKEALLKEVHHRVKNNLQIITSLLNMQADSSKNEAVTTALEESKNRVRAMALIHEKLYQSQNLELIQAAEYVPELINHLASAFTSQMNHITFDIQVENVSFDINTAIPCGMIVNELVSNALKYAFQNRAKGVIKICLESNDGKTRLIVSDNGVGLPAEIDLQHPATLGLELVSILSQQLKAKLEVTRQPGTTFSITFRDKHS